MTQSNYWSSILVLVMGALPLLVLPGCKSDCIENAVDMGGICMDACPGVTCGDHACTRDIVSYDVICEDRDTCPTDCDNKDAQIAAILTYSIDSAERTLITSTSIAIAPGVTNVNNSGACLGGGTASVSGQKQCLAVDTNNQCISAWSTLTYTFTNCAFTSSSGNGNIVVASGSVQDSETYQQSGGSYTFNDSYTGNATLNGSVKAGYILEEVPVTFSENSCAVNFQKTMGGTKTTYTGTLCGRTIVDPTYLTHP